MIKKFEISELPVKRCDDITDAVKGCVILAANSSHTNTIVVFVLISK